MPDVEPLPLRLIFQRLDAARGIVAQHDQSLSELREIIRDLLVRIQALERDLLARVQALEERLNV